MTAQELRERERAIVEKFEAAPDLPESWAGTRERMARAIADTLDHKDREWYFESYRDLYLRYADAALASLTAPEPTANAWSWGNVDMTPRRP